MIVTKRLARAAVAALIPILLAAPLAAGKQRAEAVFVPAPELKENPSGPPLLLGQTWSDESPEYAVRLQRIDDASRLAYLTHVTGLKTDPFLSPPGEVKRFETFVVEIENNGSSELSFNPRAAWLVSEGDHGMQTPYGIDDLSFAYRTAGTDMPPAYRHAGAALLDHPVFVPSGGSTSGLLLYRAVPPKVRRFQVEMSLTLASGDIVRFTTPYRRLTKKELEQQ